MPTQHQKCLLESTQTEEIICMFLLALLCVDWQMLCLSYSVMFACQHRKCCIFCCIIKLDTTKMALWRCTAAENFKFPTARATLPLHITHIEVYEFIVMVHLCPKYDKAFILVIFHLGLVSGFLFL